MTQLTLDEVMCRKFTYMSWFGCHLSDESRWYQSNDM